MAEPAELPDGTTASRETLPVSVEPASTSQPDTIEPRPYLELTPAEAPLDPTAVAHAMGMVDAPDAVRQRTMELTALAEEHGLAAGRHPGGVAAGCLYLAGHEHGQLNTQQQLAAVMDVTTTTLRRRFEELRKLLR